MGIVLAPVRRRMLAGAFIAGLALALIGPGTAFAANTASFSYRSPSSGAHVTSTRPTISIRIYDRYGLHGSGAYSMTVDGKKVRVSATYLVKGSWNPTHPDYRRLRLTYRVTHSLSARTHRVVVRTHDRRHRSSTTSWSFRVNGPATIYAPTLASPVPAKGSSSTATRPTITLNVTDHYGVLGAGSSSMSIDGAPVASAISYTHSGVYTSSKIVYRVPSNLTRGTHTVLVTVTNLKGKSSSYTWSFTVVEPPLEAMPTAGTTCRDCHAEYPTAHKMIDCTPCHGPRGSATAHSGVGCPLAAPCHGAAGSVPHVLDDPCERCHVGDYPGIPQAHSLAAENSHQSASEFCIRSGCHVVSLTREHYRRTVDGERLSCATCHESTDPAVVAAIASDSTTCESCHDLTVSGHEGTGTAHTATVSCVRAGCHDPDVAATHDGNCAACHAEGKTPSTQCTTCHAAGAYHADEAGSHSVPAGGCVGAGCHGNATGADAELVHKGNCERCHTGDGTPVLTCATCHDTGTAGLHPGAAAAHAAPAISCTTADCHGIDVAAMHAETTGGPGCVACHDAGKTPSKVCADCHADDILQVHAAAASSHAATDTTCLSSECHTGTDVTAIHDRASGGPGCAACHDPGKTPTLDCASADCHPGELGDVHSSAGADHTSSYVTCVSASCHDADVTEIHGHSALGCRSCHRPGRVLTAECATCHPGDTTALHASADSAHTVPSGTCVTACHKADVSGIHDQTGSGCSACHAPDESPSTTCTGCHEDTVQEQHVSAGASHTAPASGCVLPGCHVSDVAALHLATGGQGCARCHSPGQDPTRDCASCHIADLLTVHASASESHALPTGSNCGGAVCHESNVASIHRMTSKNCGACHAAGETPTADCAECHVTDLIVVHQRADEAHAVPGNGSCSSPTCHASGNAATIHQPSDLSCTACHSTSATSKTIVCAECHGASAIPTLHASAESSHTAPVGTCVKSACHGSNVLTLHASGPGCAVCHGRGAPSATLDCATTGCHSPNPNTVHASAAVSHVAHAGYCVRSGCHAGDLTTIHDGGGNGIGCMACHETGQTASGTCTDCHPATQALVHASSDTSHTAGQTTCAGYAVGSPCHRGRVDTLHRLAPNGCLTCHAQDKTPTLECATCHVGSIAPVHASAEDTHTASTGLCVNGQCHVSDVAQIHADSAKSCLACHASDATPSLACTTCHTENPLAKHGGASASHAVPQDASCFMTGCHLGTDVSAIHGVTGGPGCTACHDQGKVATTDCSAAACHGTDFTATHARGDATHAISVNSCVHTGCHVTDASLVHVGAQKCAACHRNANRRSPILCADCHTGDYRTVHDTAIGTGHDPAPGACTAAECHAWTVSKTHSQGPGTFTTEGGPGCRACHTTGPKTAVCATCHSGSQAPTHAPAAASHLATNVTCVKSRCHSADVVLIHTTEVTHTDGKTPPSCAACHGNPDHTATVDCAVCHVASGHFALHDASRPDDCVACHTGTNLTTVHTGDCASCHESTRPSVAGAITAHDKSCGACHATATVDHVALHAVTRSDDCASCHVGSNLTTVHTGACAKCHASDVRPAVKAAISTKDKTCTTCHTTTTVDHVALHDVSRTDACPACHAGTNLTTIHTGTCTKCHAVNARPAVKAAISGRDTNCTACHGASTDHTSSHANCNSCHTADHYGGGIIGDPNRGPCSECHGKPTWKHPPACHCYGAETYNMPF